MLRWWRRWRRLKQSTFRFFDGERYRRVDPIAVNLVFATHPKYVEEKHPKLAQEGDPEAIQTILQATCDAFGVKQFDSATNTGLTGDELVDLFLEFAEWQDAKKNNGEYLLTSPSYTAVTLERSIENVQTSTLPSGSMPTDQGSETLGGNTEASTGEPKDGAA